MTDWIVWMAGSTYLCGLAWHISVTQFALDQHKEHWSFTRVYMVALWPLLAAEVLWQMWKERREE